MTPLFPRHRVTDPPAPCQSTHVDASLPAPAPGEPIDRTAFRALYEREFAWVHRTLRRLGARDRDLEDLAHDVFVVVYRRLADYDPARPLRPWLFGIAFRVVSDYRRRASFSRESAIAPEVADAAATPPEQEAAVARGEARDLVLLALDGMDLDQRAVFVLHELDGLSIPEIAATLTVSHNTLYSRLRLARAKFADAVAQIRSRGGS
ncbi:MAG: hypothetical protein CVU56_27815 [Deltaproteobacteria bacterium HGW-Deltaproteobacteria-14]|nr:MAG: hypothetical protein CVU56_27815 [Deltaproteobacteria bacterium HGW-Deltaproteobacteria-14]